MKIVMDRGYCDASQPFCARCSAAFFQKPLGTDRPCIVEVIDEDDDAHLHFVVKTEGRTLTFELADELQEGLALEGWEFLADFEPALFRLGAAERWREVAKLATA
jgi:hypothetical protein